MIGPSIFPFFHTFDNIERILRFCSENFPARGKGRRANSGKSHYQIEESSQCCQKCEKSGEIEGPIIFFGSHIDKKYIQSDSSRF